VSGTADLAALVRAEARAAWQAGLNVVAPAEDGSKRPDLETWTTYKTRRVEPARLRQWYPGRTGLGIICGTLPDDPDPAVHALAGVEAFDFDVRQVYVAVVEAARATGLGELVDRIEAGYCDTTPGDAWRGTGTRWLVRCTATGGSEKLARRPATPEELARDPDNKIRTLIETKGAGGYAILAPTNGRVHPSGGAYLRRSGGFDTIVTITPEERAALVALLRTFDQMPVTAPREPAKPRAAEGERPGDAFNARATWPEILEPEGWARVFDRGETTYWRRPGKTWGISATTNHQGADLLWVFSSSTVFEAERSYTKFGAFALLKHQGDHEAAAKALAAEGYGTPATKARKATKPAPTPAVGLRHVAPPSQPMAVARALVHALYQRADGLVLRYHRGEFYAWDGRCWPEIDQRDVRSAAYAWLEDATYWHPKEGELPWAPSRRKIDDLIDALKAIVLLETKSEAPTWATGASAPAPAEIVAMANGLLHVPSRTLSPHNPNYFTHHALPFPYEPAAGPPTRWLRFLEELWPAEEDTTSIPALQEVMGYHLAGDTRLQKIVLMVGPKRGGKGTIARVETGLLGQHHVAAPTMASLATNFGIAPLIGKPLAIISDARLSTKHDYKVVVERLLSISGEDALTIDRKHRDPWTGRLPTRFLVLTNELPRLTDASGALASRFVVFVLTKSFYGSENPRLTDELLLEAPAIFNWALEGWDRLRKRGRFVNPAAGADAVQQLEDLSSPISAFIRDRCVVDAKDQVRADALWKAWRAWCDQENLPPGTKAELGRDLKAALPRVKRVRGSEKNARVYTYHGVGIVPEPPPGESAAAGGACSTDPLGHPGPLGQAGSDSRPSRPSGPSGSPLQNHQTEDDDGELF
jgi:putative DNA primase/helicase